MNKWQQDNWADIETEEGELVDANLWTCDVSGRQYISFYSTSRNNKGFLETDTSVALATFKVILEEKEWMEFLLLIMAILLYVLDSSQESEENEDE